MREPRPSSLAVTVTAHAKINLVLELLGERPDGYTELETAYQSIELGDELTLEPADGGVALEDDGGVGEPPERNLAYRAAESWMEAAGRPGGVRLTLTKRVPARAGLGGGSADAAAVFRGLQRLYGPRVPEDELARRAVRLGADVPFFLVGGLAIGRGRGERLEPLTDLRPWHVVLARSGGGLATAEVFARARSSLTPRSRAPSIQRFTSYIRGGQPGSPPLRNELAGPACELDTGIARLLEDLEGIGAAAAMTGSGSAVFGLFAGAGEAAAASSEIASRHPGTWVAVTRTIGRQEAGGTVG